MIPRRRVHSRLVAVLLPALCLAGCRSQAPASSAPGEAEAGLSPDPEAAGLPDIARISRYVFREMQRRAGECGVDGGGRQLDYALEVEVAGGRIRGARLVAVSAPLGGFSAPLLRERWPETLIAAVECLVPHLRALPLATPPEDGVYETRFSLGGGSGPAPETGARADAAPDPTEPGLPDLVRVARFVFREMRRGGTPCRFANPFPERLDYAFEVEVRGGAVRRARLVDARLDAAGGTRPLPRSEWPAALEEYARCLEPRLEAIALKPAPADGVYRPGYALPALQ